MKKLLPWLIVGLLLRLLIIPITLHPDIRGYNLGAYLISQGHILDFYDYLSFKDQNDPLVKIYGRDLFIYPPVAYIYPSIFIKLLWPLYPQELFNTLIQDMWKTVASSQLPLLLYLLKIPYLLVDLLIVYMLGKFFENKRDRFLAQVIWLLNPVVIYSAYMISQFDVILALSIILCLVLAKNKKYVLAAAALALGAAVKQFVFILLPLLALYIPGSIAKKLSVFFVGVGVYIAILSPYLSSVGFRRYALLASQSDKVFFAKIPISGGAYLPIFLVGVFLIYWFCLYFGKKYQLWQWFILPLLLFYSLVHFHPQWLTWVTPLLVIFLVRLQRKAILPTAILVLSFVGIVLMFEPSLNTGLFAPLKPPWGRDYSLIPILSKVFPEITLRSIFFGLFASCAILISILTLKLTPHEKKQT